MYTGVLYDFQYYMMFVTFNSNTKDDTSGAGTSYFSFAPAFDHPQFLVWLFVLLFV